MKTNVTKLALLAALTLSGATAALAEDNSSTDRWIQSVMRSASQPAANKQSPYGYAAPSAASREVTIEAGTKYLNVAQQETVKINVGGKSVNWTFDTLGTQPFPLSQIVPGAGNVTVYVATNPMYRISN